MGFNEFMSIARKNGVKTQKELAQHLKVTEQTISLWKKQDFVPRQYTQLELTSHGNEVIRKDDVVHELLTTIKDLRQENEQLKSQTEFDSFLQDSAFNLEDAEASATCLVRFKWGKIERCITEVNSVANISKATGHDKKDLLKWYDLNKWHEGNKHPLLKNLIHKSSNKLVDKMALTIKNFTAMIGAIGSNKKQPLIFPLAIVNKDGTYTNSFSVNYIYPKWEDTGYTGVRSYTFFNIGTHIKDY